MRAIERDTFPFEFISRIAERESWRKEIHRPIYHVHKWWAKRLGSVFRGILLGAALDDEDVSTAFYKQRSFGNLVVFDPFMGSGTTLGEAHKLGFIALGRDINPVAATAVRVAFGPLDKARLQKALVQLLDDVGERIQRLYSSKDSRGRECEVLYYFWVMQAGCTNCKATVKLYPSYVVGSNAYPKRKPEVQVLCPSCGDVFRAPNRDEKAICPCCSHQFDPDAGPAKGTKAVCASCGQSFSILNAVGGKRPSFELYAKLVLTDSGSKEYLRASEEDRLAYDACSRELEFALRRGDFQLPNLTLQDGYNTRQAISYGFRAWRDFFNDRQLLALGWLRGAIARIEDEQSRSALMVLFSGALEFNNLFASYKGEGTGAVRHMFAHHILKPERAPIEANLWGTPKSSGSFTNLFKGRLLRAIEYRIAPTEVNGSGEQGVVCALPFSGKVEGEWPVDGQFVRRGIYVSCGDSANSTLPSASVDLVITDPPFFDNVHYSELADFFFAWHEAGATGVSTTRHAAEVQDADADDFARKLQGVFKECHRVLKNDGLLIFTYHHSRSEGWRALAKAILGAGFVAVNSHPVKAEMSVAAPKAQAKEPIQVDIVVVCRKAESVVSRRADFQIAIESAKVKLSRMREAGFSLSKNDCKVVLFGQLLANVRDENAVGEIERLAASKLETLDIATSDAGVAA